jgi:hypothetical protein
MLFCPIDSAFGAVEDTSGDTAFLAVAGPEEASVFVVVEPADEEDLVELDCVGLCSYFVPMLEVIGHLSAHSEKGEHAH